MHLPAPSIGRAVSLTPSNGQNVNRRSVPLSNRYAKVRCVGWSGESAVASGAVQVVPVRTGSYLAARGRTRACVVVSRCARSYLRALLRYDRAGARTTARAPSASPDGFPTSVRRPRARSGAQGLIRSVDDLGVKTSSRMRHAAPTAPARHPSGSASRVMGRAAP